MASQPHRRPTPAPKNSPFGGGLRVPRFTQLVAATYSDSEDKLHHSLIALGEDGRVYRYYHSAGGWVAVPDKLVTNPY